jgi:branched-chain amino acid transport system substrate-binding protein
MISWAARTRAATPIALLLACLLLMGCAIQGGGIAGADTGGGEEPAVARRGTQTKVAMLLPLSAPSGQTAAIAKAMKQAGELALFELDNPAFQLIVKNDNGTPEGARAAAEEAIKEGAELILGPLFAPSVQAVAPVARQAGIPVLAFSNDRQVAGNGVYVFGFLPEHEVDRIVTYAMSRGLRRFAALLSEDTYGKLAESVFREAVSRGGGVIAALETFPAESNKMVEPAQRIATALRSAEEAQQPIDALFVPGRPETLASLGPLLAYAGIDTDRVKLLGSGGWDYPNIGREGVFIGGWYPSADPRGWREFTERFAKTFGNSPPRLASMAYDAVSIAIKLSGQPQGARFTTSNLTRSGGFTGVDGPVRILESGVAERGLAVLQVQNIGSKVIDPPSGFGAAQLPTSSIRFN